MTQQSARLALRAAVLAFAFLTLIDCALYFTGDGLLPKDLADWKAANEGGEGGPGVIFFLIVGPLVVALVSSLVGLFMLQKWSAWLFLGLLLLASMALMLGPNVESGLAAFVSDLSTLVEGAILGIAFFSSALEPDHAA